MGVRGPSQKLLCGAPQLLRLPRLARLSLAPPSSPDPASSVTSTASSGGPDGLVTPTPRYIPHPQCSPRPAGAASGSVESAQALGTDGNSTAAPTAAGCETLCGDHSPEPQFPPRFPIITIASTIRPTPLRPVKVKGVGA